MAAPRLKASSSIKDSVVSTSIFRTADIIFFTSADQQAAEAFVRPSIRGCKRRRVLHPVLGRCLVIPCDAAAGLPAGPRDTDLCVAVIGIAPSAAFEQAVPRRDLTKRGPLGQLAARIDHAAAQLADVERLSAWMLAGRRTAAGPNSTHEQHARTVIVFQIVDIGLEPRDIADTNARACPRLRRYDKTGRVAVGVGPAAVVSSDRRLDSRGDGVAPVTVVATSARRANMHFPDVGGERDKHGDPGKGDKCRGLNFGDSHGRLREAGCCSSAERLAPSTPSVYFL